MISEVLSSTKFLRVADHRARTITRAESGQDHSGQGHIAPLVMREVGLFACVSQPYLWHVSQPRSRRVSPDVSREPTRLTVEGIRNNI